MESQANCVQVYVRLRPVFYSPGQDPEETCIRAVSSKELEMINWRNTTQTISYNFQQVFSEDSSQEEVFGTVVQPQLTRFLRHKENVSVFAYGPTGSGKTHTILGSDELPGFIPRTMQSIFTQLRQFGNTQKHTLSMSYVEIYQEKIYDLLCPSNKGTFLLKEDKEKNIIIPGITEKVVDNFDTFENLFVPASKHRRVEKTRLNERSSRSHSILIIKLYSQVSDSNLCRLAKLSIIDLAGSEDNRRTGNCGIRLKESGAINVSLHVLSKVVDALCEKKPARVPYRDSKLTRLLQDSLGGSSRTALVLNVSSEFSSLLDTQCALNFAAKSKQILNKPFGAIKYANAPVPSAQPIPQPCKEKNDCEKENIELTSFLTPVKQNLNKHKLEMLEKTILAKQQSSVKKLKVEASQTNVTPSLDVIKDIRSTAIQFKLLKEHISIENEIVKGDADQNCSIAAKPLHPNLILTPKCDLSNRGKVFTLSVKK